MKTCIGCKHFIWYRIEDVSGGDETWQEGGLCCGEKVYIDQNPSDHTCFMKIINKGNTCELREEIA